jgi:hypothetical protein
MQGRNLLTLNQATAIEVVQFWLNSVKLKEPVKVTNSRYLQGLDGERSQIEVTIEFPDSGEKPS